jgi:hypothetical protein
MDPEHARDEEQENMLEEIIRDGDDDITSHFLNDSGEGMDGSGERMEREDDGSGVGTLIITKSGEVY